LLCSIGSYPPISGRPSVVVFCLSAVGGLPSVVVFCLSAVGGLPSVVVFNPTL
jgi:hypothetical protein